MPSPSHIHKAMIGQLCHTAVFPMRSKIVDSLIKEEFGNVRASFIQATSQWWHDSSDNTVVPIFSPTHPLINIIIWTQCLILFKSCHLFTCFLNPLLLSSYLMPDPASHREQKDECSRTHALCRCRIWCVSDFPRAETHTWLFGDNHLHWTKRHESEDKPWLTLKIMIQKMLYSVITLITYSFSKQGHLCALWVRQKLPLKTFKSKHYPVSV